MNPSEIIEQCRVKGIILETEGQQLRFNAPVGALTADLRQMLTENKVALVHFLQAHASRPGPPTPELTPYLAQPPILLSFAQQRLWFLDQFEPGKAVYNISQTRRLLGELNISALEEAYNRVVDRQAVLRTTFPAHGEHPQQVIASMCSVELHIVDYSDLLETGRQQKVRSTLEQNSQYIFDLAHGPLIRTVLLRLCPSEHLLNVTLHHIITGALSNGIFWHDLAQYYRAIVTGTTPDLPSLPIQYADYAVWERARVEGREGDRQRSYWKAVLHDAPRTVDLPTDHPRPKLPSYRGNTESMYLSGPLTTRIKAFSQQHHVTVFMTLLSVFNVWLSHMTRQVDLVVGVPITNRPHQDLARVMGFFVNTIVLHTRLQPKHTFVEILEHVRKVCIDAYAHQHFPFEQTVETIQPQRDLSRHPLFQIMFQVLPKGEPPIQWPDVEVTPFRDVWHTAKVDLSVTLRETDQGIDGTLTNSTDLFEPATVKRWARQYERLVSILITEPTQLLNHVPLLTDSERQQQLEEWNPSIESVGASPCLPELLEAQAARRPDTVAVVCEGQAMTYDVLNRRANQFAHYLRARGVGPDVRVAVYCERSLEMILGVWGIVKAGGAYVPIDPTYPQERVDLMLEDAEVAMVLSNELSQQAPLPPYAARFVWVDAEWPLIGQEPECNPPTQVVPDNLAYMIYTSGSTGRPKGVQISHRALGKFLETMAREPGMDESDRLLAVTSLSFDIAGLEILLPVTVGGQVVLAGREMAADGAQLIECLKTEAITVMQATPTTWQMLITQGWAGQAGLRVLCGGEQMSPEVAHQLLDRGQRVWNLYGPTETTVWSTVCGLLQDGHRISIGRPIANTQVYLQDPWGHPVPIGVPGELCIAGAGVARGYWQRPNLTAEQFVPNPYSSVAGTRVYRTGDVARYRADGQLEWLTRMDHQVKLRGYRIELGEIETVLHQQVGVQEVVVIIRAERGENPRLVAYVSMAAGHQFDHVRLREGLQQQLPAYMVPTNFVLLEALPRTPNGKIDRKALPAPEATDCTQGTAYEAPRTVLEELLVEVWQKVLKMERIGIHDNFFEMGGHSLLATQVMTRLRNVLELDIPLRTIFEQPTVEQLARGLDTLLTAAFPANSQ